MINILNESFTKLDIQNEIRTIIFLSFKVIITFFTFVCTYNKFKPFKAAAVTSPLTSVNSEVKKREKTFEFLSASLSLAVGLL